MALWFSLMFSLIGTAYFLYGKKQSEISFMLAGGLLMFYGYFIPGLTFMIVAGLALMAVPFAVQRLGW